MDGVAPAENAPLVAFDFDGTVTYCDTFMPFLRHAVGRRRFWMTVLRLSPQFLAFFAGRLDNWRLKEAVLARCLCGWPERRLADAAQAFAAARLPQFVNPRALAALEDHVRRGERVVIITASPEPYVAAWAVPLGIPVLATRLALRDGCLTGGLDGRNCHGEEKLARLTAHCGGILPGELRVYGDSEGDRELLKAARHPHYRSFHDERGRRKGLWLFLRHLL